MHQSRKDTCRILITSAIKVIVSDLHMSSGARKGMQNTHEDFYQDSRFIELVKHYSSGEYENINVELIINGDFMDLLKVRHQRKFVSKVTEKIAVDQVQQVMYGHESVFEALAEFLKKPGKFITYIMGNHDNAICFPEVQNLLRKRIAGTASGNLQFITNCDHYRLPGGILVAHGNNFEAMNRIDYHNAIIQNEGAEPYLNHPWGNEFIINVLAPFKKERPLIDLVKPFSTFILYGLIFDVRFTLRILIRMIYYFIKTRFALVKTKEKGLIRTIQILLEELRIFGHPETIVETYIERSSNIHVLIMGHTHSAKVKRLRGNKLYINTGTWVKQVNLDYRDLGTRNLLSYALVEYGEIESGVPRARLMRWRGIMHECEELYH